MSLTRVLRAAVQNLWKPRWESSQSTIDKSVHNLRLVCAYSSTIKSTIDTNLWYIDDYHRFKSLSEKKLREALASPTRFQSIDTREDRTDVLSPYHSEGRYVSKYRGALLLKNPNDLSVYYQLFTHVQPKIVFEMGTYTGASAMWYDDTAKSLDLDCHIYSVDIDSTLINEELKKRKPDTVNFITGDSHKIKDIFPPSMLEPLPHPWLIVEDAHQGTEAALSYLHQFMKIGDYVIVEDTTPYEHSTTQAKWDKLDVLKSFLRSPIGQNFKVDSFFTDFYGYNCTWHWHGFLKKCT